MPSFTHQGGDRRRLPRLGRTQIRTTWEERLDGSFLTAVKTTGTYCRPSCRAKTPRTENVDFRPPAASAQLAGFRAWKRCSPRRSAPGPAGAWPVDAWGREAGFAAGIEVGDGVPQLGQGYDQRVASNKVHRRRRRVTDLSGQLGKTPTSGVTKW
ncbi:Ada metal-binding domain-containing protein [Micromonospora kangleipakensis]|uniref:Ada metal-binding domain-containing protein n=1 Tax=Micromonospora kangleipakensis TaxID=1077942 RepID=UPI00102991E4|nr:Ada metal-binding domain-containing protein [Micromonospora kangleipakensis]